MLPLPIGHMGSAAARVLQPRKGSEIRKGAGCSRRLIWWVGLCLAGSFFIFSNVTRRISVAINWDENRTSSTDGESLFHSFTAQGLPNNVSSNDADANRTAGERQMDNLDRTVEQRGDRIPEGDRDGEGGNEGGNLEEETRGFYKRSSRRLERKRRGRSMVEADSDEEVPDAVATPPPLHCPKPPFHRGLRWSPRPNRYLMMVCAYGRFCNRLWCISVHLVAAALMDRTLVFPTKEVAYDYTLLLDIPHIRNCLGANTVISLEDLKKERNGDVNVTMLKAFSTHGAPNSSKCWVLNRFSEQSGVHFLHYEPAVTLRESGNMTGFLKQFDYNDEIISFGEGFNIDIGGNFWNTFTGKEPWITNCTGPILRPEPHILNAALAFVRTYLGSRYLSLHWRRTDFSRYCKKNRLCFYSIRQAAECVRRQALATFSDVIFVATDASDYEFKLFQRRLEKGNRLMTIVKIPSELPPRKDGLWTAELTEEQYNAENQGQTIAMMDRVICAMAGTFLHTHLSTFSYEIIRLRTAWNLTGCLDGRFCAKDLEEEVNAPWTKD